MELTLVFIFYPTTLPNSLISCKFFVCCLRSTLIMMALETRETSTLPSVIYIICISFSCRIALARTPKMMLNKRDESRVL